MGACDNLQWDLIDDKIDFFSQRENTSCCESINRAIAKGCPQTKLFSRTSKGRVCSAAIVRQNNTFHDFLYMEFCASHFPLPSLSIGYNIIHKYQHKRGLTYQGQTTKSAIARRRLLMVEHMKEYFGERLKIPNYHKHQLDIAWRYKSSAAKKKRKKRNQLHPH